MKMIMVAAVSLDEMITDSKGLVGSWTSDADKQFFAKMKSEHRLFVMGRNTFEASPKQPEEGVLRVVLTSHPDRYHDVTIPNQLEFFKITPEEFVNKYSSEYKTCLVLGGGSIYEEFLLAGLVDEIYLTIEPITLENGTHLLASGKLLSELVTLPTPTITELNQEGASLNHYVLEAPGS